VSYEDEEAGCCPPAIVFVRKTSKLSSSVDIVMEVVDLKAVT